MNPTTTQRIESAAIAVAALLGGVALGYPWWVPLAWFLVFDLSMLGYLAGASVGARIYNLGHSYLVPAALLVAHLGGAPRVTGLIGVVWGFHIAVDRAFGYGLKTEEGFHHTHLGVIGRPGRAGAVPPLGGRGEGS